MCSPRVLNVWFLSLSLPRPAAFVFPEATLGQEGAGQVGCRARQPSEFLGMLERPLLQWTIADLAKPRRFYSV